MIYKPPSHKRDYNGIKALKRRGLINHGSTLNLKTVTTFLQLKRTSGPGVTRVCWTWGRRLGVQDLVGVQGGGGLRNGQKQWETRLPRHDFRVSAPGDLG